MLTSPGQSASNAAHWSRCAWKAGTLEVLEVPYAPARAWSFVSPGRIAIQPLTQGIAWQRGDETCSLSVGTGLCAEAQSPLLSINTQRGAAFRVVFEVSESEARPDPRRVHAPLMSTHPAVRGSVQDCFGHVADLMSMARASARLSPAVARARAFIADHLEEDFGFETLSREAGLDRFQLCRSFGRAFGLPPFRFRTHLRVARARELLAAGHDCSYAAHAAGFCDQSHLSRAFKLLTATTPGGYLRASRCGSERAFNSEPRAALTQVDVR